jgi:hypothetical protein
MLLNKIANEITRIKDYIDRKDITNEERTNYLFSEEENLRKLRKECKRNKKLLKSNKPFNEGMLVHESLTETKLDILLTAIRVDKARMRLIKQEMSDIEENAIPEIA